jgi:two-component system cell cycle sensor histidine kinase/response regulator CckA
VGRADYSGDIFVVTSVAGGVALRGAQHECRRDHHAAQNVREELQNPSGTATSDGKRVLVVDDDNEVRAIITEHLEEQGYAVVATATGQSAYDIVRSNQNISIVVSDVVMPGMDGLTLARLLRSQTPNLPIVFLTGYSKTYDLNGEMVLTKPFTAAALGALVAKGLARLA